MTLFLQIFRQWVSCDETILSLFGFPPGLEKISVDVAKVVTGIFGKFLYSLEQRNSFINLNKNSSSGTGYRVCINSSLVGRFALVLYPGTHPETGELIFDDNLDRFLYAKCAGFEDNPKGFYFKWLRTRAMTKMILISILTRTGRSSGYHNHSLTSRLML